ncbi:MAG: hypothetical protein FWC73_12560 [Defluviitaleaceae bacterium]|nr:hypothetical protein [Defluviitaleaceae bacterium]
MNEKRKRDIVISIQNAGLKLLWLRKAFQLRVTKTVTLNRNRYNWIIAGVIFSLALSILLTVSGQYLAQADVAGQEERRLIGVFLTTEHLELPREDTGPITMNWRGQVDLSALFQPGRLDADWCEDAQQFIFPGIEGIPFFVAQIEDVYSGHMGHMAHMGRGIRSSGMHTHFGDNSVGVEIEGTIYVVTGSQAQSTVFTNLVFQTADGIVFLEDRGGGFSVHGGVTSEGSVMSQTMTEEITITENGVQTTHSISVRVNHTAMFPPEKVVVLEMNAEGQLLNSTVLEMNEIESVFNPQSETEYMVVEIHRTIPEAMHGQQIIRELVGRDDHGIPVFYVGDNGIIERGSMQVEW